MPASADVSEHQLESILRTANLLPQRISRLPILLLNVHENCNCRCVMCDIWQREDGRELDLARLAGQRESIQRLGVRQVVLTGGEPLLHRNFEGLCLFLRDCGVRTTLLTTGLLLAKRAEIVSSLIDEIIVSLDGPEEVHDQVRRVKGAFHLIETGVHEIRKRQPALSIHARSTVQKANHACLRQTVASARRLSFDSISFLAADVTSQAFNRQLIWPGARQGQVVLTPPEVQILEREIEALIEENATDIDARYIVESREKLRHLVRRFREQLGELPPRAPLCNAPWVSTVMEVDGSIRPCFFHDKVGNALDSSLEEAVNGERALEFRASLNVEDDPTCQRCVCSLNYKGGLGTDS